MFSCWFFTSTNSLVVVNSRNSQSALLFTISVFFLCWLNLTTSRHVASFSLVWCSIKIRVHGRIFIELFLIYFSYLISLKLLLLMRILYSKDTCVHEWLEQMFAFNDVFKLFLQLFSNSLIIICYEVLLCINFLIVEDWKVALFAALFSL